MYVCMYVCIYIYIYSYVPLSSLGEGRSRNRIKMVLCVCVSAVRHSNQPQRGKSLNVSEEVIEGRVSFSSLPKSTMVLL